ncbi:DapH/DapD/GlmU-related protein [Streptococcus bovimastitidis]|nr:DapH/DapD/GlmU-related protein [Streptococcus bovimastitidis]
MANKYSASEFISNVHALILTKIFYRNARLIRRPFYIRGKRSFKFDSGLTLGHACRFDLLGDAEKRLIIGRNCEIGDYVHIVAHESVTLGDDVLIASKVFISDTSHGSYSGDFQDSPLVKPNDRKLVTKAVNIGSNVWIGENVVILPGVKIGNGSIIGANSVVNKDVADNSIVVGSPARVIKQYNFEQQLWRKKEN